MLCVDESLMFYIILPLLTVGIYSMALVLKASKCTYRRLCSVEFRDTDADMFKNQESLYLSLSLCTYIQKENDISFPLSHLQRNIKTSIKDIKGPKTCCLKQHIKKPMCM